MATIRQRGSKWQAQIRRQDKTISKTFTMRADAQRWANQMEVEADRKALQSDTTTLRQLTVRDLMIRFRDQVSPKRHGYKQETIVINAFLRHSLADLRLSTHLPSHFATYRDERQKQVKAGTVLRELGLLQTVFNYARTEWNLPIDNPIQAIRKPKAERGRERRVSADEWAQLMEACGKTRNPYIQPLICFAVETGMRRGELLNARWEHISHETSTLYIPITKTDTPRTIPLTASALDILRYLPTGSDMIFPITREALKLAWQRLTKRAGIEDLHFHDLRHEAISRFFEMELSIPEVALISGHKDPRMLFRYTQLRAEDVAKKLRMREQHQEMHVLSGEY